MSGVSNTEIKKMIQEQNTLRLELDQKRAHENATILHQFKALEGVVDMSTRILDNHEKILNGKPDDVNDTGLVGIVLDLKKIFDNIRGLIKPVFTSILIWALIASLEKILTVIDFVQTTNLIK